MAHEINDANHWYMRAAELRAVADNFHHQETRDMVERMAAGYDRMGDRAWDLRHGVDTAPEPASLPTGRHKEPET